MKRGFYTIIAAQFLSSLADNTLLIAAIALLGELSAPTWAVPLLKLFFVVSYVVLAPFVGTMADQWPKGRVMSVTNAVKIIGCMMLFWTVHPLLAYAVVGFGAAAYSPAKYGILTELLPADRLVAANGWIEGATVASIILGTLLGGALIGPYVAPHLLMLEIPGVTTPAEGAIVVTACIYLAAAIVNLRIPDTGVRYPAQHFHPVRQIRAFLLCNRTLWHDHLGQISLAVTTLFWGAGATLQFIVLKWAQESLGMRLDQAAILQGIVAIGVTIGAVAASAAIPLRLATRVLPAGLMMGIIVALMIFVQSMPVVYGMLLLIGALGGFFVVPMNALLQHRGYVLMSAGHSIAVQNFNENVNILVMLSLYALLLVIDAPINVIIVLFGASVAAIMVLVMLWHRANQRRAPNESEPHAEAVLSRRIET